ncbi:hypothetical protein [Cesiribacter sp. SM1]|uniref:hypothetical protein n=1 Tax=Cesiribacter sp. SM1 TaxID=2861196 RepID=UPI001CD6A391|nr:hypothetical protein [Cesiribacter sp. SM1]
MVISTTLWACSDTGSYTATGTITVIEMGKDGYTATLNTGNGQQVNAVISRINMANSNQYRQLQQGEQVTVVGDSTRIGDLISIRVMEIKNP